MEYRKKTRFVGEVFELVMPEGLPSGDVQKAPRETLGAADRFGTHQNKGG